LVRVFTGRYEQALEDLLQPRPEPHSRR
jgi:hypothetical protein